MKDVWGRIFRLLALVGATFAAFGSHTGHAQAQAASPPASTAARAPLKAEQIDQLLSPLALNPDSLLAQVLWASTDPFEIVQAARLDKANKGKTGSKLEAQLQGQPWEPAAKSLVAVPQVLQMMDERLDWVQRLGDT